MIKAAIVIGALAALSPLAGCGAVASKQGDALDESIKIYTEGMRWQRYDTAASRIPATERAMFVDAWDVRSKDIKITDYDIIGIQHEGRDAKVQIKLSWYSEREGTLHDTTATQIWQRHGQAWFMVDETRLRGTEMPGMAEHSKRAELKAKKDAAAKRDHAHKGAPNGDPKPDPKLDDKPDAADGSDDAPSADATSSRDSSPPKVGLTDDPIMHRP